MSVFEKITDNIYRLYVPFEDIHTSVFAILCKENSIIFDAATTKDDVEKHILPAISQLGITPDMIICSHFHDDHAGGESALARHFPNARRAKFFAAHKPTGENIYALHDGELVFGCIEIKNLRGHTDDSIALFDTRTKTLVSADCLQLCGISRYGTGISDAAEYLKSIAGLRRSDIENIVASHRYVPLGDTAFGREKVCEYLDECEKYIYNLRDFAVSCIKNDLTYPEISKLYNSLHTNLPPISDFTFKTIAESINKER